MQEIGFGVIGTNFISKLFVEAIAQMDGCRIMAIFTRNKENANKLGLNLEQVAVYSDFEQFVAADCYQAAYIASPNAYHCPQALKLIQNGKHLLIEKPMASNEREVHKILAAAEEKGVVVLEAMRTLHHPASTVIKQGLSQIGNIHLAEFHYCQYSSRYDAFKAGQQMNTFNPALSNGAVMDIGIYPIQMMLYLFGEPLATAAFGQILENSIDGQGQLIAKYPSLTVSISYSKISNGYSACEIQGEKGSLLFDRVAYAGKVWIRWRDGSLTNLYDQPDYNDMIHEIKCLLEAIRNGKELGYYHQLSQQGIRLIDQVRSQIGIVFPADLASEKRGEKYEH